MLWYYTKNVTLYDSHDCLHELLKNDGMCPELNTISWLFYSLTWHLYVSVYHLSFIYVCFCHICYWLSQAWQSRGLIQYKMPSYQYRKSHCGDKMILRSFYLHNGISYTGKTTSLYWIRAHLIMNFVIPFHVQCCCSSCHATNLFVIVQLSWWISVELHITLSS